MGPPRKQKGQHPSSKSDPYPPKKPVLKKNDSENVSQISSSPHYSAHGASNETTYEPFTDHVTEEDFEDLTSQPDTHKFKEPLEPRDVRDRSNRGRSHSSKRTYSSAVSNASNDTVNTKRHARDGSNDTRGSDETEMSHKTSSVTSEYRNKKDTESVKSSSSSKPSPLQLTLYIHSTEVELSKVPPFELSDWLFDVVSVTVPRKVDVNRNGKVRLQCVDLAQYNLAKKIKKLNKYNVIVEPHVVRTPLHYCLIFNIPVTTDVDVLKTQMDPTPKSIFRLVRSDVPTTTLKVGFEFPTPQIVIVWFIQYRPKDCSNQPIRCFRCQKFGHVFSNCRSAAERCPRCSQEHSYDKCPVKNDNTQTLCANCGGKHSSAYTRCPFYMEATDITKLKNKHKISYAQAVKKYKSEDSNPEQVQSNAPGTSGIIPSQPQRRTESRVSATVVKSPRPVPVAPQVGGGNVVPTHADPVVPIAEIKKIVNTKCTEVITSAMEINTGHVCGYVMAALGLMESPGFGVGQLIYHLPKVMSDSFGDQTEVWTREVMGIVSVLTQDFSKYMRKIGEVPRSRSLIQGQMSPHSNKQSPSSIIN